MDELGVTEPIVARQGIDRIVVQLPGVQDPNEALRVLGATATLEFRLVDDQNDAAEAERTKRAPLGSKLYHTRDNQPVLLKRDIIVSGEQLVDASSGFQEGQPAVYVKLDARGASEMLQTTRENLGRPMAVVFIEKKRIKEDEPCNGVRAGAECTEEQVISVATIRGVFSSNFQITGLLAGEARELALLLRAGSLAAPLYIVEQRTVGPSLGQDNIDRGVRALIIGLLATFVFMAVYYRKFGMIANVVLLSNVVLLAALLSMLQASLSLPGIAGIVLTVGMAVDANILIFERIREELQQRHEPARRDRRRLRQGVLVDRGLEHHDADRGHRAVHVRHGPGARLRGRAVARHPDVDVHGAGRQPHSHPPDLGAPAQAGIALHLRIPPWNSSTRRPATRSWPPASGGTWCRQR